MKRMEVLDLWRSLCVAAMVVFHLLYDLELLGALAPGTMESLPARIVAALGGGSFVFISGTVARFSRNVTRRGFVVFCAGFLVAAASAAAGYPVRFGVLQLLGVCMLLFGVLRERLERVPLPLLAGVSAALFAAAKLLTDHVTVASRWLYPLGLKYDGFYSADFFPIFPWAFLFLLGVCFGRWLEAHRDAPALQRKYPKALCFPGRHSLLIYLLHQPLLYGLCLLLVK